MVPRCQTPTTCRHPDSTHCITVNDIPPQVWYGSAVLREMGRHPHHPPPSHVDVDCRSADAALDVSVLFGYSTTNVTAAAAFVERGNICPASVRTLSRLCLSTVNAMKKLGGDGTLHYTFRAVVRRHLEQLGPRTGVWEAVRDTTALVVGDMSKLECKAWSTAPWTADMAQWLQSVSLDQLRDNEWWWLVQHRTWNRRERITVLRTAAARGSLITVKHIHSLEALLASATNHSLYLPIDDSGAIRLAIENGHVHVVQYLCSLSTDRGVNPGASETGSSKLPRTAICRLFSTCAHFQPTVV